MSSRRTRPISAFPREDELSAIRGGTWHLECPEVTIKDSKGTPWVCGYGCISNEKRGMLSLSMVADCRKNPLLASGEASGIPGNVCVHALDISGREWAATQAWLRKSNLQDDRFLSLEFDLDELLYRLDDDSPPGREPARVAPPAYLAYIFDKALDFPKNDKSTRHEEIAGRPVASRTTMNVASFEGCRSSFTLVDHGGWSRLTVSRENGPLPIRFEDRVIESLQFVLAQRCDWCVLMTSSGAVEETRVRPLSVWRPRPEWGVMPAPVDLTSKNADWVWRVFGAYLDYVSACSSPEWHPISQHLRSVLAATYTLPGEVLLPLCVAVEGVLNAAYPCPLKADAGLRDAFTALSSFAIDAQMKGLLAIPRGRLERTLRICGTLWSSPEPEKSAGVRLRRLASIGVVTSEHVEAWQFYRHPVAHGVQLRSHGKAPLPRWITSHSVFVLLYRIIFNAIGYAGKYTDWSTNWRLADFVPVNDGIAAGQTPCE